MNIMKKLFLKKNCIINSIITPPPQKKVHAFGVDTPRTFNGTTAAWVN